MRYIIAFIYLSGLVLLLACSGTREEGRAPGGSLAPKDALDSLSQRIAADYLDAVLFKQRARIYLDRGMVNEALGDLGKALELNPDDAGTYLTLSDAYLVMGRITSCLESLQKAEKLEPGNNEAMLKLAEVYLVLQDYQNTFAYVRKALDIDTRNPKAYFIRGYALMETGDTVAALRSMQNALDQDQEYYEAAVQLGILHSQQNNPLAAQYFRTAIAIDPNNEAAYYLLGLYYQDNEQMEEAVEAYNRLLTVQPAFKEACYNIGYIQLVHYQDFTRAIERFSQAIDLDQEYVDAYYNRGYGYELSGNVQAARADYQKVLDLKPNHDLAINGMNRLDRIIPGN